jgi:recombination protein RecA
MKIEIDTLQDLYVQKRKTTYEIAEILQTNRKLVSKSLKEYGIDINPKQRKYELLKAVPLTKEQREMVIGSLLGDGCIAPHGRKNKSYRFVVGHCEKQKDLVYLKKAILANFVNTVSIRSDKNSTMYNFSTIVHHEFKSIYDLFYDNGKKIIRDELFQYITPRSLAFWIMDDGSSGFNQNKIYLRLHTEGFTESENIKLQTMLKTNFDVRSKVCKYNRNDKVYCYLSINKENTIKVSRLVEPYFADCMKYKIAPQRLECQSSS